MLGVLGISVGFQFVGLPTGAAFGMHISTPLAIIAPPTEAGRIEPRLRTIGRNIESAITRETRWLEQQTGWA